MRAAFAAVAALALASCAAPAPSVAPADPPGARYTAAAGEIIAFTDRCIAEVCGGEAGGMTGRQSLVYAGMRSPTEAVFVPQPIGDFDGLTRMTAIPGVLVPQRPTREDDPAAGFIPAREPGSTREEIVLDPTLGAEFGVEDIDVTVIEITPARVVYTIGRF